MCYYFCMNNSTDSNLPQVTQTSKKGIVLIIVVVSTCLLVGFLFYMFRDALSEYVSGFQEKPSTTFTEEEGGVLNVLSAGEYVYDDTATSVSESVYEELDMYTDGTPLSAGNHEDTYVPVEVEFSEEYEREVSEDGVPLSAGEYLLQE